MDEDEILALLRNRLRLESKDYSGYYGEKSVYVYLMLDDEKISEVCIDMPNTASRY